MLWLLYMSFTKNCTKISSSSCQVNENKVPQEKDLIIGSVDFYATEYSLTKKSSMVGLIMYDTYKRKVIKATSSNRHNNS